jgi:iron-sulfur cluster repair protein YtfE (RIC family)
LNTNEDLHPIFRDVDVEHAEMRELLANVHRVLADQNQSSSEVVAMLDSLFGFLKAHFQHEDEGGFFDQITEQSPRLSDRAEEVQQEHATLLTEFQTLRALAERGGGDAAWWSQLNSEFHRLCKQLMHHEHREEDLLQESFNDEIGTGD